MPLDDDTTLSREVDGTINEEYCKWCYNDGKFAYSSIEELTDFLAEHMSNESRPPEQVREYLGGMLPNLNHWKR